MDFTYKDKLYGIVNFNRANQVDVELEPVDDFKFDDGYYNLKTIFSIMSTDTGEYNGVEYVRQSDLQTISFTGTATALSSFYGTINDSVTSGDKLAVYNNNVLFRMVTGAGQASIETIPHTKKWGILTMVDSHSENSVYCQFRTEPEIIYNTGKFIPKIINLTKIFGAGNEPDENNELLGYLMTNGKQFVENPIIKISIIDNINNEKYEYTGALPVIGEV